MGHLRNPCRQAETGCHQEEQAGTEEMGRSPEAYHRR